VLVRQSSFCEVPVLINALLSAGIHAFDVFQGVVEIRRDMIDGMIGCLIQLIVAFRGFYRSGKAGEPDIS
jgi:hypothetical protein